MKKTIAMALSAALLASTSGAIFAQDAGAGAGVGAGVTVDTPAGGVSAGTETDAAAGATTDAAAGAAAGATDAMADTFSSVTASIAGSADVDLSTVTDASKVKIVLVSSLQGDATAEGGALDDAISGAADSMTTLHSNIEANATIKAKLEAEGHTVDDVIAVKSNADGSITVYVDDRSA